MLIRWANRLTGDPEAARDIVQKVALAMWEYRRFQDEEHFKKWSIQKVRWFSIDYVRTRKRERNLIARDADVNGLTEGPTQERDQAISELREAIAFLPERQRNVAVRYYVQDQSVREIARDLDIEEATVRSLLRHARSALARRLGGGG